MLTIPEIVLILLVMIGWIICATRPQQRILWDTVIALVLICLIAVNA